MCAVCACQEEPCPRCLPSSLPLPHSAGVAGRGPREQFAISFFSPVRDTQLRGKLYPTHFFLVEAVSPLSEEEGREMGGL